MTFISYDIRETYWKRSVHNTCLATHLIHSLINSQHAFLREGLLLRLVGKNPIHFHKSFVALEFRCSSITSRTTFWRVK